MLICYHILTKEKEITKMKDAVVEFYKNEVDTMKWLLKRNPEWLNPNKVIDNALQRCLGIAQFIQMCPNALAYEEIEVLYEKTRLELESMREGI
jgi:hypothetical protein